MSNGLIKIDNPIPSQAKIIPEQSAFSDSIGFEHAQRVAKMLSSSSLIPKEFQGNVQNTMIALEMANRINASPLMVMQNLYIIYGKPSWSSTFIIAAINSCKKFTPLRFDISGENDDLGCIAWANDVSTKERVESPRVTIKMAKQEGWIDKAGSKWKTMPDLMMRYRAAAFFGRLYAPEIMMGMHTSDELQDIKYEPIVINKEQKERERIEHLINDALTVQHLEDIVPQVPEELKGLWNERMNLLTKKD